MREGSEQSGRKLSRREAIQQEIQRRERALGVPDERHVYVFREHYDDEGGPPGFCTKEFRDLRHKDRFGFDEWRRRLDAAPADWSAVELVLPSGRKSGDTPGDFGEFSGLLIFSRRAQLALGDLLSKAGTFLPVTSQLGDFVGFRLDATLDALDEECASVNWSETVDHTQRWASSIYRYAFHTDSLSGPSIFRLSQHWQILVLRQFVETVRNAGLTGFRFCRVWPNAQSGLWWEQKENWC
jgi:hypothetical protein